MKVKKYLIKHLNKNKYSMKTNITLLIICLLVNSAVMNAQKITTKNAQEFLFKFDGKTFNYTSSFVVFYSAKDPGLAIKAGDFKNTQYSIPTWLSNQADLKARKRTNDQVGDGFDDKILTANNEKRTANLFGAAELTFNLNPISFSKKSGIIRFEYTENDQFSFSAELSYSEQFFLPLLKYTITPKVKGYFSVGYAGAPQVKIAEAKEIWQPLIWQEKRFPDLPYLTMAFMSPVPSTFVSKNGYSWGVVANPQEFPFDPLPVFGNSRFGIALRNKEGNAQPMIFAPVLGGIESKMLPNMPFSFTSILFVGKGKTTDALEQVAKRIYGFNDMRKNSISTINNTIENIIDYSLSKYAFYEENEKGCGYSTDLPGAVKNVSSLNPLDIAIIADNKEMLNKRAYPIMEYMLSRGKFLFIADSTKKNQFPSNTLTGPCAPISELSALYNILGPSNPNFLTMAKKEFNGSRIRNLDVLEQGNSWKNALTLYMGTNDKKHLDLAIAGADNYIKTRIEKSPTDLNDPEADGLFFWTGFTPKWIDLFMLYEYTKNPKYLIAAHHGARLYTQFVWYSPLIPNTSILVNKGGKAPLYGYLSKGRKAMDIPEELVPAWRLSEIGLTSESSATSAGGHRAIFMANFAPWILRIGYLTKDSFLMNTAKAAVVGRYRNFPGYHINTARTSIYEKENYPLHTFQELSVNSFHYNHILPNISLLIDYLVTDVFVKSKSKIDFNAYYIEGFAYLKNKGYGGMKGTFYDVKNVTIWMPKQLVKVDNIELNYLSARTNNTLCLAFANQSGDNVNSEIAIDLQQVPDLKNKTVIGEIWVQNKKVSDIKIINGKMSIAVLPNGITAVVIKQISLKERDINENKPSRAIWSLPAVESAKVVSQVINFFGETKVFTYLKNQDANVSSISLKYNDKIYYDDSYPFEITISIPSNEVLFFATVEAKSADGKTVYTEKILLKK